MTPFSELMSLKNRTALITGGAAGIGLAIAERFAEQGARVCITGVSGRVHETVKKLNTAQSARHDHIGIQADVTSEADINRSCEEALKAFGKIDILVNNAGIARHAPTSEMSTEAWDATLSTNLRAPFLYSRKLGPLMCQNGYGRIINMSSQAALVALDNHLAYAASKAGMLGLTKVLAYEWGPHGVTTNAISPTIVETELGKRDWTGPHGDAFRALIPTRRFAQPDEIALATLYLASDAAAMINGENLVVDGGYTIR